MMSIHKKKPIAGTLGALALTIVTLLVPAGASAHTREFIGSFADIESPAGIAVDLETGNVYVTDNATQSVKIYGPDGGAPADDVPTEISGVHLQGNEYFPYEAAGVAVDNSCYEHTPRLAGEACEEYDPAYGDVYVINTDEEKGIPQGEVRGVQKFKLNGAGHYELAEEIADPIFAQGTSESEVPWGLAVDSQGNLFMDSREEPQAAELKKNVEKVVTGGVEEIRESLRPVTIPQSILVPPAYPGYIAVDDSNNLYIGDFEENGGAGDPGLAKLRLGVNSEVLSEGVLAGFKLGIQRPVAVDRSTGAVMVGDGQEIAEYDSAGELQLTFGSTEALGGSLGKFANGVRAIAVNSETGLVYVVNPLHNDVDVFGPAVGPPVFPEAQPSATGVTRTSALLAGTVTPESGHAEYYFEYVSAGEYESGAADPYQQGGRTPVTTLAGGHAPEAVERVAITGLRPGTTYHYRMVVSNATATEYGPDETFTTAPATPPVASTGPAIEVGATSATLTGAVAPQGVSTSYVFEIGTDTSYAGAKLFGDAGYGTGEVGVTVGLRYLTPGTTYHYRLVAMSLEGTSYGQDATFTTASSSAALVAPASAPLIAAPTGLRFPSIAGAITKPKAKAQVKSKRRGTRSGRLKRALHACRERPRSSRAACEARADKRYGSRGGAKHSTKR